MTPPLDLAVTLDPPVGAPAGALAAISLRCEMLGLAYQGDLLADPFTREEREDLCWYLEESWKWPYAEFRTRAKGIERRLPELGRRLHGALFGSVGATKVATAWDLDPRAEARQLSLLSAIPAALSLPWELLHDEQGFLTLRAHKPVQVVRRLPLTQLGGFDITTFTPPLRVLLVTARPEGTGFVDPRSIARELLDEVERQAAAGVIELECLRPPTIKRLRERLSDASRPVHVLHFDGHGSFTGALGSDGLRFSGGEGVLAFEDEQGELARVTADELAQVLQGSGVKLVVLNACQSAQGSGDDAFSSVAARLVKGGVDAAVAMSASVLVVTAARYVEAFYRELAKGTAAPLAHERARQALHADRRRHVHRRRRDEPGKPVQLTDWWLPHFYQQRPLVLAPAAPPATTAGSVAPGPPRLAGFPEAPRYSFGGRARELQRLERRLLRGKLVALHGFGGSGKTALAREAADWLTRTGMYATALFHSFEHGGSAGSLLAALGVHLGVEGADYDPGSTTGAIAKLRPVMEKSPLLLVTDNLESVLPGGDAALPAAERTALWDCLVALQEAGTGVLLTTRDTGFGDGRLAPGQHAAHLEVEGLDAEDAYDLASRLLEDLGIDRARAPYAELRDLLEQLAWHPLAIQLVLPALKDHSLAEIRRDFAALLPEFEDDTASGRNRSLLASLEYSLRRLTDELRALLPRLAVFEGGGLEENLLAITGIPEKDWSGLRQGLERAALATAERVHEDIPSPFLRFHPVLTPYLRSLPGAADLDLERRFAARYHEVARYLYTADQRHPLAARGLVRRELPNLRRALELLLAAGELDTASDLVERIARFLRVFGLGRELDELRRRLDAASHRAGDAAGAELTWAEYLRESGRGEDEMESGKLVEATVRFERLLARIAARPKDVLLGQGSYEHGLTLWNLARCLRLAGRPSAAEARLRESLVVAGAVLAHAQEDRQYLTLKSGVLADLGDVLAEQGRYPEARTAYEESLAINEGVVDDPRSRGVVLGQLGTLAFQQRDYPEAERRYQEALSLFQSLDEPASEGIAWHQLGIVAQKLRDWNEAERHYRASLEIKERLDDAVGAARTCSQLAIVAVEAGRPDEAEGWFRRAPGYRGIAEIDQARYRNNVAEFLLREIEVGRLSRERLAEAREEATRSLTIKERLDLSSEPWTTHNILARIADLEGRPDEARAHRRSKQETFAAFPGNRYHVDHQYGPLIHAIAAAAQGDAMARAFVQGEFPKMEAAGPWGTVPPVVRRIWAGERDWHALVEGIESELALLILRVLETLAAPANAPVIEEEGDEPSLGASPEALAEIPRELLAALAAQDTEAFRRAFEALPEAEKARVAAALSRLGAA